MSVTFPHPRDFLKLETYFTPLPSSNKIVNERIDIVEKSSKLKSNDILEEEDDEEESGHYHNDDFYAVASELKVEMVTVNIAEPQFYEDFRQLQEKNWIDEKNLHRLEVES